MTACPDAEVLACLLEDRLDPATRAAVEGHVAACATCLDVLAAAMPSTTRAQTMRVAPAPAARTAPLGGRARTWRRSFAVAAGMALVLGGSLGYLGARAALGGARSALTRLASERLGVPIAIGGLAAGLGPDLRSIALRLVEVHLGALDTAEAIEIALPLASLGAASPAVERVRIYRPVLHVEPARGAEAFPAAGAWLALVAAAPAVEVIDATLLVDVEGGPPLRVEGVSGATTPVSDATRIALGGRSAGGRVSASGTVALAPETRLHVTLGGSHLAADALPGLRGRARGVLDLRVDVTGTPAAPRFAGRALLSGGRLLGWNPFGATAGPLGELAGPDLEVDTLHVVFAARGGSWRVRRARLEHGGVVVSAVLRADTAGRLDGHGVALSPASPPAAGAGPEAEPGLAFTVGGTLDAPLIAPTR